MKKTAMSMPLLAVCDVERLRIESEQQPDRYCHGAVVGGVVGSALTGGSTVGTVSGAAAGALIGHEIGKKVK